MKNLGFGMMRLPVLSGPTDFDYEQLNQMVDAFLAAGYTYFDTSFAYHNGKSEEATRKAVVERYRKHLFGVPGLTILQEQEGVESNYAYFPVVFDGAKYTRDEAVERLAAQGINARKYFFPLTNHNEAYGFCGEETPVALHISERVLTLPLYPDLAMEDVDRICEIITE